MAKRKTLKCTKCDRSFSMAGHLARHMNAMHKRKSKAKRVSSNGRSASTRKGPGRPRKSESPTRLLSQLQSYERELAGAQADIERRIDSVRQAIAALKM